MPLFIKSIFIKIFTPILIGLGVITTPTQPIINDIEPVKISSELKEGGSTEIEILKKEVEELKKDLLIKNTGSKKVAAKPAETQKDTKVKLTLIKIDFIDPTTMVNGVERIIKVKGSGFVHNMRVKIGDIYFNPLNLQEDLFTINLPAGFTSGQYTFEIQSPNGTSYTAMQSLSIIEVNKTNTTNIKNISSSPISLNSSQINEIIKQADIINQQKKIAEEQYLQGENSYITTYCQKKEDELNNNYASRGLFSSGARYASIENLKVICPVEARSIYRASLDSNLYPFVVQLDDLKRKFQEYNSDLYSNCSRDSYNCSIYFNATFPIDY